MWPTLIWLWLTLSGKAPPKRAPRRRPPFLRPSSRPRLEALEDRCLMSAGALDPMFNPTGSTPGIVTVPSFHPSAVAIQTDGKIVAAGTAGNAYTPYPYSFGVARYNGNGSLDTSFNGTGTATTKIGLSSSYVQDMAIQSDGKILVAGYTASNQFAMARFTTTGALDQSFGQHGIVINTTPYTMGRAYGMAIQPDGKIVLAGDSDSPRNGLGMARFNSDGSRDGSFGNGGWVLTPYNVLPGASFFRAKDVAIDSVGRLVVAGSTDTGAGHGGDPFAARYNSNGSLDTSLGGRGVMAYPQFPETNFTATHVAVQTDGKIVLTSTYNVIRLHVDGTLDTDSFGPLNADGSHAGAAYTGWSQGDDVQLESDGKIIYVGGGPTRRLLSDGSWDPTFTGGGFSGPDAIAIQPADGNIVIGGLGGLARLVGDTPTSAGGSMLGLDYFPSPVMAGRPRTFTVWADNAVVALASGYTGTVHFTSSDPLAVLPADYTFTAADQGAHTFSATFSTPGTQSLFVTDTVTGSLAASQTGIRVSPTSLSRFSISAPASVTSGVVFSVTVTALDPYGNVGAYTGTVHVTSSDPSATLPADYTFLLADRGVYTFTGLVLSTKGVQTLTITDVLYGTIFGTVTVDVV